LQSEDENEKEKEREKQARQEASLREREKEVRQTLASHMRERDKERELHKHDEAVQHFTALLVDLVTVIFKKIYEKKYHMFALGSKL